LAWKLSLTIWRTLRACRRWSSWCTGDSWHTLCSSKFRSCGEKNKKLLYNNQFSACIPQADEYL
jgi:hypothetical protein